MLIKWISSYMLIMLQLSIFAQTNIKFVQPPEENDFAPALEFLSSDWMQGREAGAKGAILASDYIASIMQLFSLQPNGDIMKFSTTKQNIQSYFQEFVILKYKVEKSFLAIVDNDKTKQSSVYFSPDIDYTLINGTESVEAESQVIFAGYGLKIPNYDYDDYKGINVKGKIVIVLNGFPGHSDTTSMAFMKYKSLLNNDLATIESKRNMCMNNGALAMIVIDGSSTYEAYTNLQSNKSLYNSAVYVSKEQDFDYEDADYALPNDTSTHIIPTFILGSSTTQQLISSIKLDIKSFENDRAKNEPSSSFPIKHKKIAFSVLLQKETILERNVLGIIAGKDTTKYIVIGGHYDHLGMRDKIIYNGADDNASGASGMLAIAKVWSESGIQPSCNLIFASWGAEEKGLLGSQYFAENLGNKNNNILLYINLDMISRSILEDTACKQLSIGTRISDNLLKNIAIKNNKLLEKPFELELWDVTGHTGSDYASFTAQNIPIMTYNTGLHNDYHTPRDVAKNVDVKKMKEVLKLINNSIQEFLNLETVKH